MGKESEVLDCKRDKPTVYKKDNLYRVLAFDENGIPCQIDLSISGFELNGMPEELSLIDALAAMTSLALREFDHDYVAAKLSSVSRTKESIPAMMAETIVNLGGNVVRSEYFEGE